MKCVCVFCGSRQGVEPAFHQAAEALGAIIAQRGLSLVYGGGGTGLMGSLARGCMAAGGEVIGVLPRFFDTPELAQPGLTDLRLVEDMHERKSVMGELGDGFIALPGGLGTFEEFFEVLTWAQIGLHRKPIGVLDTLGYFEPLFSLIQQAGRYGFLYPEHAGLIVHESDPERLLDSLMTYQPPEGLARWVQRGGMTG